ncbi:MAG: DUF4189 domain-containing protein [Gallionella sp.]|nr:DUF4189 domain-containing protein [Gallionella sp.]MDD4946071.1 DUF4189 domain-containing protein [Gallionella sp.]MDD5613191.1 DUF4189 domain-containing protein [Gallionella sp.]
MKSKTLLSYAAAAGALLIPMFANADPGDDIKVCQFVQNGRAATLSVYMEQGFAAVNLDWLSGFSQGQAASQLVLNYKNGSQLTCYFSDPNQFARASRHLSFKFYGRAPEGIAPQANDNDYPQQGYPQQGHPQQPRGNTYIAIAFSQSTGSINTSLGTDQRQVSNSAVEGCNANAGWNRDCRVLYSGQNTCASIAGLQTNPNFYVATSMSGSTAQAAQNSALHNCRQQMRQECQLLGTTCSWDPMQ